MKRIILLRHGKVDISNYKSISSTEFGKWIVEYDNSNIKSSFLKKDEVREVLDDADILICSKLKRSTQSLGIFDKVAFETSDIFNEAQLPYFDSSLLKISPKVWLVFFRILWFFGYSGNCESLKKTKQRAFKAANRLMEVSNENKTVVLVGHGIMNKLIRKELLLKKYEENKKAGSDNWDYSVFERK